MTGALTASITEADWTTTVIEMARWNGWHVHHSLPAWSQDGKRRRTALQGNKGLPDLVLARDGVVLLRELKGREGPPDAGAEGVAGRSRLARRGVATPRPGLGSRHPVRATGGRIMNYLHLLEWARRGAEHTDRPGPHDLTDPATVVLLAVDYTLGRVSYAVLDVTRALVRNPHVLDDVQRRQVADQIRDALRHGRAGMDCDAQEWQAALRALTSGDGR